MAWFCEILVKRTKGEKKRRDSEFLEEVKDDSRTRLADNIDEGSFTMEDEERSGRESSEKSDQKPPNTIFVRIKKVFRTIYKAVSSVVGLLILLVIYTFIGAAIFRAIEGRHETLHKNNITNSRDSVISTLFVASTNLSRRIINQTRWNETVSRLLVEYESAVHEASVSGVSDSTSDPTWNFWGSMFFCGTIYTTIGYGHIAPSTGPGRVMTMVYAAIGIPLALICLADLGKRFTLGLKIVWAFCRRYGYCCKKMRSRKKDAYEIKDLENDDNVETKSKDSGTELKPGDKVFFGYKIDDEFNIPVYVAIGMLVVYIFLGAAMYSRWEEWSFLESFYFVFISISTIGFGDVLPKHPKFFLLSFVYVFIGLSLVSMCVNVAIEFFSKTIDKAKVNIDKAKVKAREKAKEAAVKMQEVQKTMERAKDRARERAHDMIRSKSFRGSQERESTPSDDVKHDPTITKGSPARETLGENNTSVVT